MADQLAIQTLAQDLKGRITNAMVLRVGQLLVELTQLMRQAYEQQFKVNNAGGAASSLTFEVDRTNGFISAIIGAGTPNSYLKYLEYGVKGTKNTPAGNPVYSRSLAPPIKNIYDWVKLAALPIPKWMVTAAAENLKRQSEGHKLDDKRPWYSETDPLRMLAYWTQFRIKQKGTPALRIIERVLRQQQARIQQALTLA